MQERRACAPVSGVRRGMRGARCREEKGMLVLGVHFLQDSRQTVYPSETAESTTEPDIAHALIRGLETSW